MVPDLQAEVVHGASPPGKVLPRWEITTTAIQRIVAFSAGFFNPHGAECIQRGADCQSAAFLASLGTCPTMHLSIRGPRVIGDRAERLVIVGRSEETSPP